MIESSRDESRAATDDEDRANEEAASAMDPAEEPGAEVEAPDYQQQAEDNWNKYLRAVADIENLRKRNARDVENARKFGVERLAAALLPVRDSLEAGLTAAAKADADTLEVASLLEGEQAILRLLDQVMEEAGVRVIDPEGEPFDPERHEAISMQPSETAEPNSVLEVVQKGYELNQRVMRPARVVVAREPSD